MSEDQSNYPRYTGRRVITGRLASGREGVVSDADSPNRVSTVLSEIIELWTVDQLPTSAGTDDATPATFDLIPPSAGAVVRMAVFAPDSAWKGKDLGEAFEAMAASKTHDAADDTEALHVTDTVDIATVMAGEIWAILEDQEVLLRPGDTLVQRGTKHSWSNRGAGECTVLFTMFSAGRVEAGGAAATLRAIPRPG